MQLRLLKRLSPEELFVRLQGYDHRYRTTFQEFQQRVLDGRAPVDALADYVTWSEMLYAYRGYLESGELHYIAEETMAWPGRRMREILTAQRLQLLSLLLSHRPDSINDLARLSRRDVKNVYLDLAKLARAGLLRLRREARRVIPDPTVEEIHILLR